MAGTPEKVGSPVWQEFVQLVGNSATRSGLKVRSEIGYRLVAKASCSAAPISPPSERGGLPRRPALPA